jgi:hypothetical protein
MAKIYPGLVGEAALVVATTHTASHLGSGGVEVLVGKDGTVKLKRQGPTALADIFGLIDSMPMRQREMGGVTLD